MQERSKYINTTPEKHIAAEMIGQDKDIRKLFLTLTNFCDAQEAKDYAFCIHKCRAGNMPEFEELFVLMINALPSAKGWRANQVVDMVTGIQLETAIKERKEKEMPKENK